jgi:L-ribulokinase
VAPDVFDRAHTWVELTDWIPAVLTGRMIPEEITRGVCAAGHKGLYHPEWGGYPDAEFLAVVDDRLVRLLRTLPRQAHSISTAVGMLTPEWASKLKLAPGIPVAVGGIDAHMGAVGSGVAPGTLVKIIGTSGCDLTVAPLDAGIPDIAGICGMVPESVLPGCVGIEAGQAAVGDLFNWFVECLKPEGATHESLTEEASQLRPGESGLLALDWHNGNRNLLADPRLSGLVLGLSLRTRPAEIYRALIEGTAFGARAILERLRESGVAVERVVCGGGIAAKNRMLLQIYADVLGCRLELARSAQACALGSAMAGAVVAGEHADFAAAAAAMTHLQQEAYEPNVQNREVYDRLYRLWRLVHDAFGVAGSGADVSSVMKELLDVRDSSA